MPRRAEPDIYVARESFVCELDGVPVIVHKGERVRRGHPLIKLQAGSFEPADEHVSFDVEQATAAPGEKRER